LAELTVPASVEIIADRCFHAGDQMKAITFEEPFKRKRIGELAFSRCMLKKVIDEWEAILSYAATILSRGGIGDSPPEWFERILMTQIKFSCFNHYPKREGRFKTHKAHRLQIEPVSIQIRVSITKATCITRKSISQEIRLL
jgi:hypothetical protein